MPIIEALLYFLAFAICIYSSITDLKHGIVSNKALLYALLPCILLNTVYYGFFCRDILAEYLLNCLAVAAISVLFYAIHVWGGGDSKMLLFLAVSTPARLYYYYGQELLPLLSVVIFTFSVGYIYLIFHSGYCAVKKTEVYKSQIDKHSIICFMKDYVVGSIYLTLLINLISRFFNGFYYDNQVLFLFVNVFLIMLIFRVPLFRKKWLLILCAAADILFAISTKSFAGADALWVYLVIVLLFILRQLISRYNYQSIPVSDLKPGMILSAPNVIMMLPSGIADLPTGLKEDLSCKLTEPQISAVKKWYSKHKDRQSITIVRKIPFALFISMGYFLFALLGLIR